MKLPLFIANRISLGNDTGRRAPSVIVAVAGIALSLAVMILTVCIVVGFKTEISEKVRGFDADLKVLAAAETNGLGETDFCPVDERVRSLVERALPGAKAALTASTQGVMKTSDNFAGVLFTGYDENHDWSFIRDNLVAGEIPDYRADSTANSIVISAAVASDLGLAAGDRIDTYFFSQDNLRARRFTVAGIYDTHFRDYDRLQCFASLETVRKLAALDSAQAHAVEVRGLPAQDIPAAKAAMQSELINDYVAQRASDPSARAYAVEDMSRNGAIYFNWLELLDTNVVVILILMSAVAAFTIVSSLFTLVLERVNMIGILKALGASSRQVTHIFMWLGLRIVLLGMLIGDAVGLGIAWAQHAWHLIPLDPEAYYLTSVPIVFTWWQILAVNAGVLALSALILLVPSRMIAKISPSTSIRYD